MPTTSSWVSGTASAPDSVVEQEVDVGLRRLRDVGDRAGRGLVGDADVGQAAALSDREDPAVALARHRDVERSGQSAEALERDDEVRAEAGAQAQFVDQLAGPDAGGVDHRAGADVEGLAGQLVAQPRAVAGELGRAAARDDPRAVQRGGAGEADGQARVVLELGVPGQEAAAQAVARDAGGETQQLVDVGAPRAREVAGRGAGEAAQAVAEREADAGEALGARVDLRRQRHGLHDRPDEVRCGLGEQDVALAGALHGDADRALGQVAQAAVDELGAPAARAPGQVAALDERDAQPARGGVQRDAGAGDAAADDEEVERRAVAQRFEVGGAAVGVEEAL